jgi:hypothetical protein
MFFLHGRSTYTLVVLVCKSLGTLLSQLVQQQLFIPLTVHYVRTQKTEKTVRGTDQGQIPDLGRSGCRTWNPWVWMGSGLKFSRDNLVQRCER